MAGIQHLQEIYKKKGKDFISDLFDKYVTINEKLDGSCVQIEKDPTTKELTFFKRNSDVPISIVDRTLMKYYEKPISHFQGLDQSVLDQIPAGWRFGMEYFVNENPQEISYDRVPKNNLVLSYIHVKNGAGKMVRTIQEKFELDKWADLLEIERSPIIFQGVLSAEQKIKIMDFLDTPFTKLAEKFKTQSFVKFIISILNPKLKKTTLNDDLTKNIEGVVFRFGEDGEVTLAKMVDPVFELMAKDRHEEKVDEPNDIFALTVIDLTNFIESLSFKKLKPKGKTLEERYLNFICAAFNELIAQMGDKYKDVKFNEPAFMKKKEFDLNTDFIKNDKTLELINENESFKKLFKIMLATFRKKKKKPNGIMSKEVIQQFNGTVGKIHDHLSQNLLENEIPTFADFLMIKGDRKMEPEEEEMETFSNFREKMQQVMDAEVPQTEEEKKKKDKAPKTKNVNIIVGRFQPFHNGHLAMAKDLHEMNNLPTVIVAVHPGHNKSGKSPFTIPTTKTCLNNLSQDSDGIIKDYCIINRGFINDVFEHLRDMGHEPVLWGAGSDRINDYKKQMEHNFKQGNELKINDKFQIVQTGRYGSGTEVRECIDKDQFGKFKELVPKSVQGNYQLLRTDMENAKREAEEAEKKKKKD